MDKDNKKVFSIVIPAYNAEATIGRTLSSLIPSVEYIKEVLIGNDRSTDNTINIIKSFSQMLPIKVATVEDDIPHGPSAARNAGLDIATGKWIIFIDADDMIEINALGPLFNEMLRAENVDELPIIVTPFQEWNTTNTGHTEKPIMSLSWVHGKIYNRDFLTKHNIRFNTDLYTHEDTAFNNAVHTWIIQDYNTLQYPTLNFVYYRWIRKADSMTTKTYSYSDGQSSYIMFALTDLMYAFWHFYRPVLLNENVAPEIKRSVSDGCINQLLMYYFYYQSSRTNCSSKRQNLKNLTAIRDYYLDIKELLKIDKDAITSFFDKDPKKYNDTRNSAQAGVGALIEEVTFSEFIDILEKM